MAVKLAREEVEKSRADSGATRRRGEGRARERASVAATRTRRRRRARRASRRRDENARDESNAQRTAHARHHVERERQRRDESRGGVRRLARLGGIGGSRRFRRGARLRRRVRRARVRARRLRRRRERVSTRARVRPVHVSREKARAAATDGDDDVARLRSKLTDAAVDACGRAVARSAEDHVEDARVAEIACLIALSFAECAASDKMSFFVRECRGRGRRVSNYRDARHERARAESGDARALAALATRDERTKRAVERRGGIDLIARCADELGVDEPAREVSASQAVDLGREDSRGSREEREVDDDERR